MTRESMGQTCWHGPRRVLVVGVVLPLAILALSLGTSSATAAPGGHVSGTVFFDMDGDGVQGPEERGLAGVTLTLTGPGPDATTVTDTSGSYRFDGVVPGTYAVVETDPAGYLSTTLNARSISLEPHETQDDVTFGDALPVTLTGVVFEDQDQDGEQAYWEPGVPGALVTLYPDANRDGIQDPQAPPVATTTTFNDGGYVIPDLLPAWYVLVAQSPPGYVNTTPDVLPLTLISSEVTGAEAPSVGFAPQTPTAVTLAGFSGRSEAGSGIGELIALAVPGLVVAAGAVLSRRRRG